MKNYYLQKSKFRILIIGSNGMLGHMLFNYFSAKEGFETIGLSRKLINGLINKKNIIKYSAGGLRDFSRTAASNEIMWRDIFFENKDNIIDSINIFIRNLKNFKKLIKNQNNTNVLKILKNSKKIRKQIINLKQDVSKPNFGRDSF